MKNGTDICRPIAFLNNYVMPTGTMEWEYLAFGVIDYIHVDKQIICGQGAEESPLVKMRSRQKRLLQRVNEDHPVQWVYGFRQDDPKREEQFWEDSIERPFFFFCRAQYERSDRDIISDRKNLEKSIVKKGDEYGNCRAITYLTFDNTDILIVLRTDRYEYGARIINELNRDLNNYLACEQSERLENSFTSMAVRREWLNRMKESELEVLNRDKIDYVSIKLMEKKNGCIEKIWDAIDANQVGKPIYAPILGVDNYVVVYERLGWGDYLRLYRDNDKFRKACVKNAEGMISTIVVKQDVDIDKQTREGKCLKVKNEFGDKWQNACDRMYQHLQEKLQRIEGSRKQIDVKELKVILNMSKKFSKGVVNDYLFPPLLDTLEILLDLIEENSKYYYEREPFDRFIKGFIMYSQSDALADHYTDQVLDFNTRIYGVPLKLSIFYNAYLYYMVRILNVKHDICKERCKDKERQYHFIAFPGISDHINVVELYKQVLQNQRLMQVEIPEYGYYSVHDAMLSLAHETAHYVGSDIRNRSGRSNRFLNSYAHIYIKYIVAETYEFLKERKLFIKEDKWNEIVNRMRVILTDTLDKMQQFKYVQEVRLINGDIKQKERVRKLYQETNYVLHFGLMEQNYYEAMWEIVQFKLRTVFIPIVLELDKSCGEEFFSIVEDASLRYMAKGKNGTQTTAYNVFRGLMSIYKETFADLMAIEVLQASPADYINTIIVNADEQKMNTENLYYSDIFLRVGIVIAAKNLVCEENEKNLWISAEQLTNEFQRKFANNVIEVCLKERDKEKDKEKKWEINAQLANAIKNSYARALLDGVVIRDAREYLVECSGIFNSLTSDVGEDVLQVRKIYQCFSPRGSNSGTVEEQISGIGELICRYKKNLIDDWNTEVFKNQVKDGR